jgi:hypothetical protein
MEPAAPKNNFAGSKALSDGSKLPALLRHKLALPAQTCGSAAVPVRQEPFAQRRFKRAWQNRFPWLLMKKRLGNSPPGNLSISFLLDSSCEAQTKSGESGQRT